ncbi:unannotated protein [freshwater metagenome]|uniref:Unannotated protein n=1 Tax=freshwater metagenome TaxID=449393 RepID=A0A6J7VG73_9ZZZZ
MVKVTDPFVTAVPSSLTFRPIIPYTTSPAKISLLVIVMEIGFPAAVCGIDPSGANHATTKETEKALSALEIKSRALVRSV